MSYIEPVSFWRLIASNIKSQERVLMSKVGQVFAEKKARKWMWIGLGVFIALQIYFVQEMLAALALFTGVFVILAVIALVLYLIDRAGQWSLGWASEHARPVYEFSRRVWVLAEDISRRLLRRPRSEPAQ
jgi:cytosine/uracil/thiamine/allantoin permease